MVRIGKDGLLLVKAAPSDNVSAAVTSAAGWTDLSEALQGIRGTPTRETHRLLPRGDNIMGKVLAGNGAGQLNIIFARNDGDADVDPALFFEPLYATQAARFNYVVQRNKAALTVGNVTTPAPSVANPQYTGSGVITNIDLWGGQDGTPELMNVTVELDEDYAVRRA